MSVPSAILLSTASTASLRWPLQAAGFTVLDHVLGSTPAVDFEPVAVAVVEAGDRVDAAAAQTRRWRIELGDVHIPVIWVLPASSAEQAAAALDTGADACLTQPVDAAVLAAQVRAGIRVRSAFTHQAARSAEARLLGDQLQKAYRDMDLALELAKRVQRGLLPRTLPAVGAARFAVCHRPRSRAGGDFYGIERVDDDHVAFFLGDTLGPAASLGSLVGTFAREAIVVKDGARCLSPDEVLGRVNRELLSLGLEDPPFVAMLYAVLNAKTGDVAYARAGLPPPAFIPATGEAEVWMTPGPYLGVFNAEYPVRRARLVKGDRLAIGTDGTRPGADAVPETDHFAAALGKHRERRGQEFVDAVAKELLATIVEPDDFTLMVVEMVHVG